MNDILEKVAEKHNWLEANKEKYGIEHIVMSVLIGSQNYFLNSKESDVDVYSIVFPPFLNFIKDTKLISFEHEFEDGSKIAVKDIRLMFNLLRKPSPNSVECFVSHYKIFNPLYDTVLTYYLQDDDLLYYLTHANFSNMVNAIAGCAYGLHGRNMTIGKKYAHVLRLHDMLIKYLDINCRPSEYLELNPDNFLTALYYKFGILPADTCSLQNLTNTLSVFAKHFLPTEDERTKENISNKVIDGFQRQLTKIYLQNVKQN